MSFRFLKKITAKLHSLLFLFRRFVSTLPVVAINISDEALTVLYLNGKKQVIDYNRNDLPAKLSLKALEEAFEKAGLVGRNASSKEVALTLPESKIFIEHFVFSSSLPPLDLEKEIYKKASEILPIDLDFAYYDYQIRKTGDSSEVLFAAAERPVINKLMEILSDIGIRLSSITAESICLGKTLLTAAVSDSPTMILNIGSRLVICSIFNADNRLEFATTIPNSDMDMDYLIQEVKSAILHYKKKRNFDVGSILLTGDTSLFPDLNSALKTATGKDVRMGDLNQVVFSPGGLDAESNQGIYATAMGLVIHALENKKGKNINLLNSKKKINKPKTRPKGSKEKPSSKLGLPSESKQKTKRAILSVAVFLFLIVPPFYIIYTSLFPSDDAGRSTQAPTSIEDQARISALANEFASLDIGGAGSDKEAINAELDRIESEVISIMNAGASSDPQAELLFQQIHDARDSLNNIIRITDTTPYIDFKGAGHSDPQALGLLGSNVGLAAYEAQSLYGLTQGQPINLKSISSTESVVSATAMDDYNLLLFLTHSGRIIEYDRADFSTANIQKTAVDLAVYGKYLYLLSPKDNQIYKYIRGSSGYAGESAYNSNADLSGAISMAIDGSIYVLKSDGSIVKLLKSEAQPFDIQNMIDISGSTRIFTSQDLPNLYILDPLKNRVVVIEKESPRYLEQIVFGGIANVQDIFVSSGGKSLYLITKEALYRLDI